jgi:hypothetical protein
VILTLFIWIGEHPAPAQVLHAVPQLGDQFVIHHEMITEGTYTLGISAIGESSQTASTQPFKQKLSTDFAALVIRSVTLANAWQASYRYDYLKIESQIGDATPVVLEVWPQRVAIDHKIYYDWRLQPDYPPPVLSLLLLEDLRVVIGNKGEVLRFEECERYREMFPLLDLTQPLYETWMHRPPEPLSPGVKWTEDRPFRLWANRITVPASHTYEIKSIPTLPIQPVVMEFRRTIPRISPRRIPIPIGKLTHPTLRYDALGPDLNNLPPDTRVTSLSLSTQGTIEYRLDLGFITKKESHDWIFIEMEAPLPDGLDLLPRQIQMDRTMRTAVTYHPGRVFSYETREILFSKGSQ